MASLGFIRYATTRPYRIQSLDDKVRLLNEGPHRADNYFRTCGTASHGRRR